MITLKKVIIRPKHKFIIYLIIKYNGITYKIKLRLLKNKRKKEKKKNKIEIESFGQ